ncbi:MAG: motility associated factor glycosyltransferase family protein [Rhodospirillales bacterium]|nr:motility associated factor glycosyltransferase family protein [Rhodospirillales bacterium]
MNESERYAKNLACFDEYFPTIAESLRAMTDPQSLVVWEGDEAIDIRLGSGLFYGKPAREFVDEQIDQYFEKPERIILNKPEGAYLDSQVSLDMLEASKNIIRDLEMPTLATSPQDAANYLLIIGIGLGLHIEPLIKRTGARHIIIVEPIPDFLGQSLFAVDWCETLEYCNKEGIDIDFICFGRPRQIQSMIFSILESKGLALVEGTYIYIHYKTWLTNTVHSSFKAHIPTRILTRGFYEDEILMMRNAASNFNNHSFNLLDGEPRVRRPEPAFIVGAGPSVDQCIETIRKWKDHAVIFSSGTALQVLLHHGIIPDFQTEVENLPEMVDKMAHIHSLNEDKFSGKTFGDIKFISPATADPGNLEYFDESFLYFRDSVSSTMTLGTNHKQIIGASPLVANTSLALATNLGFYKIYLFGCDCGVRDKSRHHSDQTVYYTTDQFKDVAYESFEYTYPGNFGGTVYTDGLYEWTRQMLEFVMSLFRVEAYNCSDGTMMEGAVPKMHSSVSFEGPPLDKKAIFQQIREESERCTPGSFFQKYPMPDYLSAWDRFIKDFNDVVEVSLKEDSTFNEFYERLNSYILDTVATYDGVSAMVDGSAKAFPHIACYFASRVEDKALREEFLKRFKKEYARLITGVSQEGKQLFAEIIENSKAAGAAR